MTDVALSWPESGLSLDGTGGVGVMICARWQLRVSRESLTTLTWQFSEDAPKPDGRDVARSGNPFGRLYGMAKRRGIARGVAAHPVDMAGRIKSRTAPAPRIQHEWLRAADVFHIYCDLMDGHHQQRRGGPSIGKAITLVEANAKSRGTSAASLWHFREKYKDVSHLVAAAAAICAEVRTRACNEPFGPFGLSTKQFGPFQMAMLMPDLVLAVALEFEQRGLTHVLRARTEPVLDPETLWRIPADINVVPVPPPVRKIRSQDLAILNARRAGNRGSANKRVTTPVSA